MKRVKYLLLLTILGVMLCSGTVTANSNVVVTKTGTDITVVVDGKIVEFPDQKPYVDKNNRTLVPVRFPAETLGATVEWVAERQEVLINKEADEHLWASDIKLKIGDRKVLVNGKTEVMDTVAVITNSRTMVPVRFISEYMGATVRWHVGSNAAHIFTYGQSEEEQNRIMEEIAKQIQKLPPVIQEPVNTQPQVEKLDWKIIRRDVGRTIYVETEPGVSRYFRFVCTSHPELNKINTYDWNGNSIVSRTDNYTTTYELAPGGHYYDIPLKKGMVVTFDVYEKINGVEVKVDTIVETL